MVEIPAPDAIFGHQGITQEDRDYQGSRFRDVKAAVFANPYQKVWGAPGEPLLPVYKTTNRSVYQGILPGGEPPQFPEAVIRSVDSGADLRWGEDGKGFRRFVRPHGVCVTGLWEITEENPYSGYFQKGRKGLAIARISAGVTKTLRGTRRSYGMALKLYPTADESHSELLRTANVFLANDLGGGTANRFSTVPFDNAPQVTGWNRGTELPILLREGVVFEKLDRMGTVRQVYPIAELGKPAGEPTRAPEYLRLQVAPGHPVIDEDDVREEVLAHLFDKGEATPRRTLTFDVLASDTGKKSGNAVLPGGQRQTVTHWKTLGKVTFNDGVASYNGDFVIHFRHPSWREDKNDPGSAVRQDGKKVR